MSFSYREAQAVARQPRATYTPVMIGKDPKSLIQIARQSGTTEISEPLDLGARVRELRKARDWTLEQAAGQAGLARSTLSKIENGQMSPTYEALKKLATGLEISVPQLFTPPAQGQVGGRMAVTKNGEGSAQVTTTYEHELLGDTLTQSRCCPIAHAFVPDPWMSLMAGCVMAVKNSCMC